MKRTNLGAFLFTLIVFGFLLPWWKGLDFLDPVLLAISFSIPLVFVAPMVASEEGTTFVKSRVSAAIVFAFTLTALIALNGIATVNVTHWFGRFLLPNTTFLAAVVLMDLAGAVFLAIISAFLLRTMPPAGVRRTIRFVFFALLIGWVSISRFAPAGVREVLEGNATTDALTRNAFVLSGLLLSGTAVLWRRALNPPVSTLT